MPPNAPSNSRLPQLAVWSGYGTVLDNRTHDRTAVFSGHLGDNTRMCVRRTIHTGAPNENIVQNHLN